jgi:integrase
MAQKRSGNNGNNPKPGSIISVDPIKNLADIRAIKRLLADRPLYYGLFAVGVNTNLRASDLLALTAGQVRDLVPGDTIEIRERKTGKKRGVTINKTACEAIQRLLASREYQPADKLFTGQRGPLTVQSLHRLVKQWCASIRLPGNYGSHTLRKTWGYHQRVTYGVGLPELMECLNHSSQKTTLRYLGIGSTEIRNIFQNEI